MCRELTHTCYCGVDYICEDPNWLCPTINGDENGNMCSQCEDKFAAEYNAAHPMEPIGE